MKKLLWMALLIVSPLIAQEQTTNITEIKEDPNAKFRTDTVSFAVTTSLLGAGYLKGNVGLLSQTSLEIFAGIPANHSYIYLSYSVITPLISPMPSNIFTGTSFQGKIGYGNWVYKKLDDNKKGWIVGVNTALIIDVYNSFVAKENKGFLDGWISGMGITANMRAIYQLNRSFGFVIGMDMSYYLPWSFITGLDKTHSFTGGVTMGLAF